MPRQGINEFFGFVPLLRDSKSSFDLKTVRDNPVDTDIVFNFPVGRLVKIAKGCFIQGVGFIEVPVGECFLVIPVLMHRSVRDE